MNDTTLRIAIIFGLEDIIAKWLDQGAAETSAETVAYNGLTKAPGLILNLKKFK